MIDFTKLEVVPISKNLMAYLPKYWQKIAEMEELQKVAGIESGLLEARIINALQQLDLDNATWGLNIWEKELGLYTNDSLTYIQRREMIKAKIRGNSTTTIEVIKNVASAFSNGEVEVIEHNDQYYFEIKFVGTRGIPNNMDGLKEMLEMIKPAHLGINYIIMFITWGEVKKSTWEKAKARTWKQIKELPIV